MKNFTITFTKHAKDRLYERFNGVRISDIFNEIHDDNYHYFPNEGKNGDLLITTLGIRLLLAPKSDGYVVVTVKDANTKNISPKKKKRKNGKKKKKQARYSESMVYKGGKKVKRRHSLSGSW